MSIVYCAYRHTGRGCKEQIEGVNYMAARINAMDAGWLPVEDGMGLGSIGFDCPECVERNGL